MPSFDERLLESLQRFGRGFPEVHKFLDEFAGKPGIGMRHRCLRHHLEGIEEVRRRFGYSAAEAAKQHIISDLKNGRMGRDRPISARRTALHKVGLLLDLSSQVDAILHSRAYQHSPEIFANFVSLILP
jgi:hypothetical protein